MSLAADVPKAGMPKPRRVVDTGNFQYSTGYAFRKPRGRQGVLTWRIPLAQITHAFNVEGAKEIVWPWVDANPDVRLRQVAQIHHRAVREGWNIRCASTTTGIRIKYLGERARKLTKSQVGKHGRRSEK